MAGLKEQAKWEELIYQIEEDDPVWGGADGITNKPTRQLANRTLYLKQLLEAAGQNLKPKTLTATTQNAVDETGHTHQIALGSTSQKGLVQMTDDTGLDSSELALTAKGGKKLSQQLAQLRLDLNGYIPNSKKNNATNVDSSDLVATSRAVKAAYDKAVEAANSASSANNNANGRVSKSGDTMTGGLTVPKLTLSQKTLSFGDDYFYKNNTGRELHGLHFMEDAGEPNDSSRGNGHFWAGNFHAQQTGQGSYAEQYRTQAPFYVDEINSASRDTYHPFIKGRVRRGGQYGAAFAFGYTTRQGEVDGFGRGIIELIEDNGKNFLWRYEHDGNFHSANDVITGSGHSLNKCRERVDAVHDLAHDFIVGNGYVRPNDFIRSWYPHHYSGTEVYKIRHLGLMIVLMNTNSAGQEFLLPEAFDGHAIALVSDRGDGNQKMNARFLGGNRIFVDGRRDWVCHVMVIGMKNV